MTTRTCKSTQVLKALAVVVTIILLILKKIFNYNYNRKLSMNNKNLS